MSSSQQYFYKRAESVSADLQHRSVLNFNISKYDQAVLAGKKRYAHLNLAKKQASDIKSKVIDHLPQLLLEFETQITNNGAEVYWAMNTDDLFTILLPILKELDASLVVKSKSMVSEEIDLNDQLKKVGIESLETDLGEFIVQVAGEKPYHIVTPAMHKSKNDIAELFHKEFGTSVDFTATELTDFVRHYLRNKYREADVGFTGANFLCANEGAVAVTENEGNAFLSTAFPKTHIVIAGLEKVLPSIDDLDLFWPLLAAHGTGQQTTVYSNLFFGPKKSSEVDGPERMVVILLDNGRSDLFNDEVLKESLKCIRCGACLNGCPVYKNIGGYTYDTTYSGPIGSVISPALKSYEAYGHLSFSSTLCGKCEEVCPVKIPLTKLLLHNRQISEQKNLGGIKSRFINTYLAWILSKRKRLDLVTGITKTKLLSFISDKLITPKRQLSNFASESFSEQWIKDKKK